MANEVTIRTVDAFGPTLVDELARAADQAGHRGVLHFVDRSRRGGVPLGERVLAYSELWRRSTHAAAGLLARGVGRGRRVVLTVDDADLFLIALWACLRIGVVVAPMPGVGSGSGTARGDRLGACARFLGAPILCSRTKDAAALTSLFGSEDRPPILTAEDLLLDNLTLASAEAVVAAGAQPEPDDLAVIQFSSGSTAEPKGVTITHAQAVANVAAKIEREGTTSHDRIASWFPYYHDFGLFGSHLAAVFAGTDEVRLTPEAFGRRPLSFLEMIEDCRITQTYSTNTGLDLVLRALDGRKGRAASPNVTPRYDLSSIRLFVIGAEMIAPDTLERFAQVLSEHGLARMSLTPGYGLAETVLMVSGSPGDGPRALSLERAALIERGQAVPISADAMRENSSDTIAIVSVGKPLANLEIEIRGGPHEAPLPVLRVGRVMMRGRTVTAGYLDRPEETAAARAPDGWFDTGDLGFRDAGGRLYLTGRAKEVIIRNGQNVYPHDVERIAARILSDAARAIVACAAIDPASRQDEVFVFVVLADRSADPSSAMLELWRADLSAASGIPIARLTPIKSSEILRTSSGKIRRQATLDAWHGRRQQAGRTCPPLSHANDAQDQGLPKMIPAPASPVTIDTHETMLTEIWHDVLGIGSEEPVADQASFFVLGGDSLKAMRLIAHLEERLGRKLPVDFPFRLPTFAMQRDHLIEMSRGDACAPPANDLEVLLRDMAAHAFEMEDRENLGVTDSLIARAGGIGGVMRFAEDLNGTLDDAELTRRTLARTTLRDMAREIAASRREEGGAEMALMPFQETLYYHRNSVMRNEPTGLSCYIVYRFDFEGDLKPASLDSAFDELIRRHALLRAEIDDSADAPRLRIRPGLPPFKSRCEDIGSLSPEDRDARLAEIDREDHDHRCDLAAAPLFYARAIRRGPDSSTVTIHVDHMLIDGFSFLELSRELFRIYDCIVLGEPASAYPAAPKALFGDYVFLAEARRRTKEYAANLDMHLGLYRDLAPKLSLPMRANPAMLGDVRFATHHDFADPAVMREIDGWCRSKPDISLNSLLLAGLFKLINLWGNEDDLVVNMPIFNREHYMPAARTVIGSFIDIMPVRLKTNSSEPLADMARRIEAFNRRLLSHPVSSIELSRKIAQRERIQGAMSSVIFSNSINLVDEDDLALRTLRHTAPPRVHTGAPGTWIDLVLYNVGSETWHLDWNYVRGLFDESFIATLAEQYRAILADFAAAIRQGAPENRPFRSVSAMTASHHALLEKVNDTDRAYPVTTLPRWIGEAAEQYPDKIALTFQGEEVSYRGLEERSNEIAQFLIAHGVGVGSFVALALPRSADLIVAQLAVMKAGAAYIPVDPTYPADRIAYMVADCEASVLVLSPGALASLAGDERGLPACAALKHLLVLGDEGNETPVETAGMRLHRRVDLASYPAVAPEERAGPDDLAYMIYTSGSTGKPKGVMIAHRAFGNFIDYVVRTFARGPDERFALVTSPSFDMTLASNWGPLITGASLDILSEESTRDVPSLLAFIAEKRISLLNVTPSHFGILAASLQYLPEKPDFVPNMRILLGGEVINPADLNLWLAHYPAHEIVNEYGPTETSVASTFFPIPTRDGRCDLTMVPIGKPIQNTRMYILNDDRQPCMIGVSGRLFIGGDGVAKGYWRKPEQTARAFVPDLFDGRPGRPIMYDTGDMARWLEDGNIQFLGRNDRQVNLRGYRIELGEIEAAMQAHEGIASAAAVLRQDERSGQSALAAFYVEAEGSGEPSVAALRAHLAERLPEYMVPGSFRRLDAMPLTPSGKLDLKALPAGGEAARPDLDAAYIAPRNELETRIAAIWRTVLDLDRVGVEDSFWDIGGDSIRAIRLITRLNESGLRIGLQDMFRHGTVAALAERLAAVAPKSSGSEMVELRGAIQPRLRILCLPYSGGSPFMFRDLAARMPDDVAVHAAQYPGVDGRSPPLESIEAVADGLMGALRERGAPPTILLGYCFGGYVAHALARRAVQEKLPLAGLVLTGATPPGAKEIAYGRDALAGGLDDPDNMRRLRRIYAPLLQHMDADEQDRYWTLFKVSVEALRDYEFGGQPILGLPSTILTGQNEEYSYIHEFNESWRRCFPSCRFVTLREGGHLMVQTHPAAFAGALSEAIEAILAEAESDAESVA